MTEQMTLDPVTFELIHSALRHGAKEMAGILKRSSYSPIIREMEDFSCAIFSAEGDSAAQDDRIPAQLGAMSLAVKTCRDHYPDIDEVVAGDVFILNHPYMGCMHTPDVLLVMPVFHEGEIVAWVGDAAHHVDLGGPTPGTLAAHHRSLFAEGLVFPPTRLYLGGEENRDLLRFIAANVREPRTMLADLRAQHASLLAGERAVIGTIDRYGSDQVAATFKGVLDQTERSTRLALSELPDGEAEWTGFMDDDGLGGDPVRIHVRLVKRDDTLIVDFSGTDGQVDGALNVPWASTRACVAYLVRSMISLDIYSNDGMLRPIEIVCPSGNLLNPMYPAAVSVRHNTCQRIADTLVRAASALWPERAVASSSIVFFGLQIGSKSPRTGDTAVLMEVVGGGTGGFDEADGMDGVDTYMSNVGLLPVEVAETEYSVRILRSELIDGTGGDGFRPGGRGIRREYQILDFPQQTTLYCEQVMEEHRPEGVGGGEDASATNVAIIAEDGTVLSTASKTSTVVPANAVIRVETSGGGGYGAP